MRKILVISLALLLLATYKNLNAQDVRTTQVSDTVFSFTIRNYYDERSKDSHNYSKSYTLKSGILFYDYDYNGYPDDEEEHKQKKLNDSTIIAIKIKLKELSLYQNYKKSFPVDEGGFRAESGSSLTITTDSVKYYIQVNGGRPIDMEDKMYENLSEFYYYINSLFEKK